jgi:transcriptional regulator with XRE-family HTH domain
LGWSQEELAGKAGVSLRSLSRFEKIAAEPSAKVRDKLYRAFLDGGLQFIATNSESGELDGVGVRRRPEKPHQGIRIL